MTGWEFIEAFGWGSVFLLLWLFIFGEIGITFGACCALLFFLVVGLWATRRRAEDDRETRGH